MERLVVVIPALNESKNISACIRSVHVQGGNPAVCVVDGGSSDDTEDQAKRAGAKVLRAPRKGRGLQMNLGWRSEARDSSRTWFLFLHGDSVLPEGYKTSLEAVINSEPGTQASQHAQTLQQKKTPKPPADGGVLGQPEPLEHNARGGHTEHNAGRGHTEGRQGWDAILGPPASSGSEANAPLCVRNTQAQRRRRLAHDSVPVHEHHQPPQPLQPPQQMPAQHEQQQQRVQQWLWPWRWYRGPSQSSSQLYSKPLWLPFFGSRHCRSQPLWGCFHTISTELQGTLKGSILSGGVKLRTTLLGMPYGDQGIFVHRSALEKLGGFQEWPLLEDVDLVHRLKRDMSAPAILPLDICTSGRRWLHAGFWRNAAFNQLILGAWALGYDPQTLASWYYCRRQ